MAIATSEKPVKPFTKQSLAKFSGRVIIHVTEVAEELGITSQAVLERSLNIPFPIYVIRNKSLNFKLSSAARPISNEENEDEHAYSLLQIKACDVAEIFADGEKFIGEFIQDECKLQFVIPSEGSWQNELLHIDLKILLVKYEDLLQSSTPSRLGAKEKDNLLKSIAAMTYLAVNFYDKFATDEKLGEYPKINISNVVQEVHLIFPKLGLSLDGLAESSLEGRISQGMKLIEVTTSKKEEKKKILPPKK